MPLGRQRDIVHAQVTWWRANPERGRETADGEQQHTASSFPAGGGVKWTLHVAHKLFGYLVYDGWCLALALMQGSCFLVAAVKKRDEVRAFEWGDPGTVHPKPAAYMALSLIRACRSLALSTWLLSFCFVHLLCLDFTVAEKEEWYTAFVNITYLDPVTSEVRTEKSECGRYGEQSPKKEARGIVLVPSSLQDREACDPNLRFPPLPQNTPWVALVAAGNCTYREKIRNVAHYNASAVVIYNVGSGNANDTITMPHPGERQQVDTSFWS